MSFRNKTGAALRDLVESHGIGAVDVIRDLLESGKVSPSQFSLKEIWEACERDQYGVRALTEAVSSDMFPQITGELINSELIKAYDNVKGIGDMLCRTVKSNMEIETYAGFDEVEMPEEVQQGRDYNESDMGEKYVVIPHTKYGRILSVTEEMIYFDKTGQVLDRARRIGMKAAQYREKIIVEGVQDIDSDVFRPSAVATALYRTSASGSRPANSVSATFGEAGLTSAYKLLENMTDENSNYILIDRSNVALLCPFDIWVEVAQMQRSTLVPEGNENAVNIWKGAFTPYTSPYVGAQSTSTWYIGDFMSQFVWSEVWPLQTFTAKPGNYREFKADIKSQHKVRFYGEIGAVDDHYVIKCT